MEKYLFIGVGGFIGSVCQHGHRLGQEKANCGVVMTIEKVDVRKYSAGK
jgi:hypothetical protein